MTEASIVSRDSTHHILANGSNFSSMRPNFRSSFPASNGTSGLSSLAQRFRENWLKCNPPFRDTDDSLTNLTWLFDMSPFSLESDGLGTNKNNRFIADRPAVFPSAKISWQPTHPYAGSLLDPQVRMDYRTKWTGKPPFSYASLICLAMRELGKPKVTLSDIYGWIMTNFAYYRHTDSSWQNSVRHNLSLNKCFEKVPREKGERGKGGFWRVNPRHADWLEANLAKCRRAAPPPGPPPPIPRSLLLEKQQEQQHTDGFYFTFPQQQQQQPPPPQNAPTLICYQSVAMPPDVSNEVEAVTVKEAPDPAHQQPPAPPPQPPPQPHVRRRKTPPCSMYPTAEKAEGEPDLVEVIRRPPQYPAFTNRKRLALGASASRNRPPYGTLTAPAWSQPVGFKREPGRSNCNDGYYDSKSWKAEDGCGRASHFQSSSFAIRRRRTRELMDTTDPFYVPPRRPQFPQSSDATYEYKPTTSISSAYPYTSTSDDSTSCKRRVETQVRHDLPEEQTLLLPDHLNLSCLDSLSNITAEPTSMETNSAVMSSWKEDFLDFPGVLPWQTVSSSVDESSNLTVECNTPDLEPTGRAIQSSTSSSPSPLASFASFGQSTASSASSNADSGVASLVNPSDGLDLGPLDLDFDTVSSALNDLVESNGCSIPPIDVDFGDLGDSIHKSLAATPLTNSTSSFSQHSGDGYADSAWNYGVGGTAGGGFYENGLSLT
uniref:Fork-head domain-containing protein n=2 Tax=Mesocestoides corti TaxID=53468 RepID=A0A5K3FUB3_MESCO